MKFKLFWFAVTAFFLCLSPSWGSSQPAIKIAILPLAIYSLESLDPLKEGLADILSSRVNVDGKIQVVEKMDVKKAMAGIKGEVNPGLAKELGSKLGADYVLFGSLTKIGENISLDTKLIDSKTGQLISTVFTQGKGLDEIIPKMGEFAQRVQEKILGPTALVATPPRPVKEPPPPVALAPEPKPEAAGAPKEPEKKAPVRIAQDSWMSQALPFEVKGMAIGDVDGDGRNEIVLIDRNNVWIYRWQGELKPIKKIPGFSYHDYIAVDIADINQNGRAEIFVTSVRKHKLESFILEYDQGEFKKIAADLNWHLRIFDIPGKGRTLLGQQGGLESPFYGPICEMEWDGRHYSKKKILEFPNHMNIHGLAVVQFREGEPEHYLYIDRSQFLTLVSKKGEVLWQSKDRFGTNNFIIGKPKITTSWVEESDFIPVNLRVLVKEINGKKEVFLPLNSSLTGEFIKRVKIYNKGEIQRLSWNGTVMDVDWHSKELGGYIADCQYQDIDGDPQRELVAAVSLYSSSSLTESRKSAIVVFKQEIF